jgi:hypothetical protein
MALDGRAEPRPTSCPAGPSGEPPGPGSRARLAAPPAPPARPGASPTQPCPPDRSWIGQGVVEMVPAEERQPWCPAWLCHTADPCATSQKQSCSPSRHCSVLHEANSRRQLLPSTSSPSAATPTTAPPAAILNRVGGPSSTRRRSATGPTSGTWSTWRSTDAPTPARLPAPRVPADIHLGPAARGAAGPPGQARHQPYPARPSRRLPQTRMLGSPTIPRQRPGPLRPPQTFSMYHE